MDPGSPSSFEESEVDSSGVAPWQVYGVVVHLQGLVPPAQMFVLKARNLPIPRECLAKWGTAFLPCVQTDWSAPCCPISRIAVLSLRLPSASFEGKGPNPECRFMGLGELPGFLWSREHDSPVISSLFQSEVLQAPLPPHRTPNPCKGDAQPVCNQRCSLSFQWE